VIHRIRARRLLPAAAVLAAVLITGCGDGGSEPATTSPPSTEVTLLTHDSFAIPDVVWDEFEAETGITVTVLQGGDAGTVVNQAILTKDNPTADVLFGIDNTFLSRGLAEDLFVPYRPTRLDVVPDALELAPNNEVTPIDFGDVCLNYDAEVLDDDALPVTLRDLTNDRFAGQLVVENPATSSPGLAFLLSTIVAFPEDADYTWRDFWIGLRENDVLIADGWETAYYGEFSGGAGEGDRPLVVSYASSPPAEVIFADPRPDEAPTGVIPDGCFRQIEFAGILTASTRQDAARSLIDFMLSRTFQDEIALNMFVFPANENAAVPPEFLEYTTLPDDPATVPPDVIEANREQWIAEWTELMR
jgi:thiamine transport system substrate-binding protein